MPNKVTPSSTVKGFGLGTLLALAIEVRTWQKTGLNTGKHLPALSDRLIKEHGMLAEGALQVAEALVVQEVCDRWIAYASSPTAAFGGAWVNSEGQVLAGAQICSQDPSEPLLKSAQVPEGA